jgi:hypothetical protein
MKQTTRTKWHEPVRRAAVGPPQSPTRDDTWAVCAEAGALPMNFKTHLPFVLERAWLPLLRIKLICKGLLHVTNEHLDSLQVPLPNCTESAAKIQRAWFESRIRHADERLAQIDDA